MEETEQGFKIVWGNKNGYGHCALYANEKSSFSCFNTKNLNLFVF